MYDRAKYLRNRENCIAAVRRWQKANPEKGRERRAAAKRAWRLANPEKASEQARKHKATYYAKPGNLARLRQKARDRYAANLATVRKKHTQYAKKNPEIRYANQVRRRMRRLNRLCTCCVSKDFHAIYREARHLGHEVGHRVRVADGGLHCVHNLQVLSAEAHRAKTASENSVYR